MPEDDLKTRLKHVMVDELMLDVTPDDIQDDAPLFGVGDGLELDSVDALQLVVAIEKNFGLKIPDAEAAKSILISVNRIVEEIERGAKTTADSPAGD